MLQLEPVLQTLVQLDWIGRLNEIEDSEGTRYVLLADVQSTALEPLMRHLLLPPSDATAKLWKTGQLSSVYLKDVSSTDLGLWGVPRRRNASGWRNAGVRRRAHRQPEHAQAIETGAHEIGNVLTRS